MTNLKKGVVGFAALSALLVSSVADVSAAPRYGMSHRGGHVYAARRGYRHRGPNVGPAIAGAALGLIGAATAAAAASQYQDRPYYGPGYGGYGAYGAPGYYGPGPYGGYYGGY